MTCRHARRSLARWDDDPALADHLAGCAACRALAAGHAAARRGLAVAPPIEAPPDRAAWLARVASEAPPVAPPFAERLVGVGRFGLAAAAAAAAIALVALALADEPAPPRADPVDLAGPLADPSLALVAAGGEVSP
jgi:hypothetical protein